MNIELVDKKTGEKVHGILERAEGILKVSDVIGCDASARDRFELEYGMFDYGDTDSVIGASVERQFVNASGNVIPESEVEPYVEDMADSEFKLFTVSTRVLLRNPGSGYDEDEIASSLKRRTEISVRGGGVVMESDHTCRTVNATEASLLLQGEGKPPGVVGLDDYGRNWSAGSRDPDERPGHPIKVWRGEVTYGATKLGYKEWTQDRVDSAVGEPGNPFCLECGNKGSTLHGGLCDVCVAEVGE